MRGIKALMDNGQRTKHHGFGGVEEIKDHKHAGLVNLNIIILDKEVTTDRRQLRDRRQPSQLLKGNVLNEVEEGREYN